MLEDGKQYINFICVGFAKLYRQPSTALESLRSSLDLLFLLVPSASIALQDRQAFRDWSGTCSSRHLKPHTSNAGQHPNKRDANLVDCHSLSSWHHGNPRSEHFHVVRKDFQREAALYCHNGSPRDDDCTMGLRDSKSFRWLVLDIGQFACGDQCGKPWHSTHRCGKQLVDSGDSCACALLEVQFRGL